MVGAGRGVEPEPRIEKTEVTDSTIDRIAKIARTDIFRHKLGTKAHSGFWPRSEPKHRRWVRGKERPAPPLTNEFGLADQPRFALN